MTSAKLADWASSRPPSHPPPTLPHTSKRNTPNMGTEYNSYTGTATNSTGGSVSLSGADSSSSFTPSNEFHAATGFEVAGDVMSTVRNPTGSSVVGREVRSTDTVETHGHRMTVAQAIQLGFLSRDAGGNFTPTATGTAGAKAAEAPKGAMELASGGTAEDAVEADFRGTPVAEEALSTIIAHTEPGTQLAAFASFLDNEGQVEGRFVTRMAEEAGVTSELMEDAIATTMEGMGQAVMQRLAPLGVYDEDAFARFLHSDKQTHQRLVQSARDLMMSNSTKGFEGLAQDFAMSADRFDPVSVEGALEDAGIPFTRKAGGGVVLDLTAQGRGQMAFRQAVELGFIKLSRIT